MAERLLDEFLDFLKPYLVGSKELTKLIKLRFLETDETFRNSVDFSRLIHSCRANIQKNKDRPFVYIKDFVSELKAYRKKSNKQKKPHKRKHGSDTDTSCSSDFSLRKLARRETEICTDVTNHEPEETKVEDVTQSDIVQVSAVNDGKEVRSADLTGDAEVSSTWSPSVSPRSRVKVEDDNMPSPSCCKALSRELLRDSLYQGESGLRDNSDYLPTDPTLGKVESSEVYDCENSSPKPSLDPHVTDTAKSHVKSNSDNSENKSPADESVCSKSNKGDIYDLKDNEKYSQSAKPSVDLVKDPVEISEASTSSCKETENKLEDLQSKLIEPLNDTVVSQEAIPVGKSITSSSNDKKAGAAVKSSEKNYKLAAMCNEANHTLRCSEKGNNSTSTSKDSDNTAKNSGKGDNSTSTSNDSDNSAKSSGKGDNSTSTSKEAENTKKSSEKGNNSTSTSKDSDNTAKSSGKGNNSTSMSKEAENTKKSYGKGENSTSTNKDLDNTAKSSGKGDNSTSTSKEAENTKKSSGKASNSTSMSKEAEDTVKSSGKDNNSTSMIKEADDTATSSGKDNNSTSMSKQSEDTATSSGKSNNSNVKKEDIELSSSKSGISSASSFNEDGNAKVKTSETAKIISTQEKVLFGLKLTPKRVDLLPAKPSTSSPTSFGQGHIVDKGDNSKSAPKGEENTPFLSEHKAAVNEKHIRRLEILLAKLRNEIEKVKERELTLDELEEDDSCYLYEDRLQKKFVKVWDKLCELKGRRKTTGRPIEQRFTYEGTRYPEVNKKIESFINKKKIFPDFHDIRNIITKANKRKSLNLSSKLIEMIARDAFTDVGNQLQERRKEDFLTTFGCRLTDDIRPNSDPALTDSTLKEKLEENRKQGKLKLDQVISKYSEEQITRGEEPEEVGDQSDEEKRETSCSPTNEGEAEEFDIPILIEDINNDLEKHAADPPAIVDINDLKDTILIVDAEIGVKEAMGKTDGKNKKDEVVNIEIVNKKHVKDKRAKGGIWNDDIVNKEVGSADIENDVIKTYKKIKYQVNKVEQLVEKDDIVIETESDNSVDEQQDDDQSDESNEHSDIDNATSHLPKTYASVLSMMNIHENLDSPCSSESKSIKGVIDVDDGSNHTESSAGIYMDIADDSDVPSQNESATSESSDSDITEILRPVLNKIKSPAKSAPTWKLSIRTPQKRLVRKALGLKPSSRSPKILSKKRPSVCIVEESNAEVQSSSSKRFKISLNASFTAETTKIVKTLSTTAAATSSEVIPIDDPIISSSTGDPDKRGNYVEDNDIIVLD